MLTDDVARSQSAGAQRYKLRVGRERLALHGAINLPAGKQISRKVDVTLDAQGGVVHVAGGWAWAALGVAVELWDTRRHVERDTRGRPLAHPRVDFGHLIGRQ